MAIKSFIENGDTGKDVRDTINNALDVIEGLKVGGLGSMIVATLQEIATKNVPAIVTRIGVNGGYAFADGGGHVRYRGTNVLGAIQSADGAYWVIGKVSEINVRWLGAAGNGTTVALSTIFSTLADAQKRFPKATALTETIDWHAHQLAIDMSLANLGGCVYSPTGRYLMKGPSALCFPLLRDGNPNTPTTTFAEVNWRGDGDSSIIEWREDKGTVENDNYAVMCGYQAGDPINQQVDSRYGPEASSNGFFRDLYLLGPASAAMNGNNQLNVSGCKMSGVCWASRRIMQGVRVSWFYNGLDLVGDHTNFFNCHFSHNYYNMYLNHPSPTMYCDLSCGGKTFFYYARKACVGIAYTATLGSWHFSGRTFMGSSPYIFFKEPTPATIPAGYTDNPSMMTCCQFDMIFFEAIGNAIFWDENLIANGQSKAVIDRCVFNTVTLGGTNDAVKMAGRDRCMMQVATLNGGSMNNFTLFEMNGTTMPLFTLRFIFGEFTLSGNVEGWLTNCATKGITPLQLPFTSSQEAHAKRFALRHDAGNGLQGGWQGRFFAVYSGDTVNKGDVVGSKFNGVQSIRAAHTSLFSGIARNAASPVNPPASGTVSFVAVAESGQDIPVNMSAPNTVQKLKKISTTTGTLTDATGPGDGRIVGICHYNGTVTITSPAGYALDATTTLKGYDTVGAATYTLLGSDIGRFKRVSVASTITFPNTMGQGYKVDIMQSGTGALTFTAASGATILASTNSAGLNAQNATVTAEVLTNTTGTNAEWLIK